MPCLKRTRRRPGPLLLIALVWWALTGALVRAHDPGLSTLDLDVRGAVSASLSIAAPDVALLTTGNADLQRKLEELAHEAVRLFVDGEPVPSVIDEVSVEDGAARVRLSFGLAPSRDRSRRLEVTSDLPRRLARGHRQLVVVRVDDHAVKETLLDAESGPVAIDVGVVSPSTSRTAWHFLELGVRHILSGYDHLIFVAGLLLAARSPRQLAAALTAFTVAHSVSLALVVIGGIHLAPSIVEPLIAASIAWVGLENLVRRQPHARWLLVFGFGLIHGFGFAGALMELGFGSSAAEVALALVSFNAGVEAGQLAVAAALLPLVWAMQSRPAWHARLLPLCSVMIVIAGGYWLVERLN